MFSEIVENKIKIESDQHYRHSPLLGISSGLS